MFAVMAKNLPHRRVGFGLIVKYYTRSKGLPATITQTYLLGVTKEIFYNIQCSWRERFITQLCLQIWSGGMLVLLASP
jgi:hypothetical protein